MQEQGAVFILRQPNPDTQERRDFAKWYNDNDRGGFLRYFTKGDEFKLHDGERWNYIAESVLRPDFKEFLRQHETAPDRRANPT